ncbi:MAG TPA: AMP-binding protein [Acidimicrobiales bacterium]|nr:AMP-binding protein [Acidimicrobiales bacterium]
MPELVAIDGAQGPSLPAALERIWARGDAACVLDDRLEGVARAAQLAVLAPTRLLDADGHEVRLDGRGVEAGDALVIATSGSTAAPRAAVLTHAAVAASALATSARLAVEPSSDRWLCCLPCAHVGGSSVVTRALLSGTPVEVHRRFDPRAVAAAARGGATLVSLVATALRRVADPLSFRAIVLGGAATPAEVPQNVVSTWGLTETGSGVVYDGRPLDGVTVAVVEGELYVRGPMLARGYRDGTVIDALGPDGERGWLATGDAGAVVDGVVEVFGRLGDVINTGGEKVWPADVERVLLAHPAVAEAAVWKRADTTWGERVVAWVVPCGAPPTLDEVRAHVAGALPPWAAPKELVVVAALPRTASGKVTRRALDGSDHPA